MKRILLLAMIFLLACGDSGITITRKDGFNLQYKSFSMIKAPSANREITLTVKIIITDDVKFPNAVGTYSYPENIIRINGKDFNQKIILCEAALGHEVIHALAYFDKKFMNPDQFEANGI